MGRHLIILDGDVTERRPDIRTSFFDRVLPEPNSGCWLWTGALHPQGYGKLSINKKLRMAHRISYELHRGSIPEGCGINHHCDTRCCVNPDHLYAGDQLQNVHDARRRGRTHYVAKLTADDIRFIRSSGWRGVDLAKRYGVTGATISSIRRGLVWRHVQ